MTRSWAYVAKADKQRASLLSCVNPTWVGRLLSVPFTSLGAWFSASREVMAEFYRYLGGLHSTVLLDQCLHFLVLEDCKVSGAPAQGDTYPGSRTSQEWLDRREAPGTLQRQLRCVVDFGSVAGVLYFPPGEGCTYLSPWTWSLGVPFFSSPVWFFEHPLL